MSLEVSIVLAAIGGLLFLGISARLIWEFANQRSENTALKDYLKGEHPYQDEVDALFLESRAIRQRIEAASHEAWLDSMSLDEALDDALTKAARPLLEDDVSKVLSLTPLLAEINEDWEEDRIQEFVETLENAPGLS